MTKQLIIGGVVLVIAIAILFGQDITAMVAGGESEDYQKITIDMKNWEYYPQVIEIEKDVLTRIYITDEVQGCFRDLIIPELNIRKRLSSSKDFIEVTFPEGEYTFACSMYMGTGKIIAK